MTLRKIIFHKSDPEEDVAYWVECSSLDIASIGDTIEEAIAMIREAIELYIEELTAHREPIPLETSRQP